jgi:hypothetical protein
VNAHATMGGIQGQTGSQGPGNIHADPSETGSLTLTSETVIALTCSYDNASGSTPYIGSVLWAQRGTSVVSTTAPWQASAALDSPQRQSNAAARVGPKSGPP